MTTDDAQSHSDDLACVEEVELVTDYLAVSYTHLTLPTTPYV